MSLILPTSAFTTPSGRKTTAVQRSAERPVSLASLAWAALALIACALPSEAHAAARNVIERVTVRAHGDGRAVYIETREEPTFTVFRLTNPMRVVVDISGGDVSRLDGPQVIEDGVVSQIAAQQFSADGFFIGRLIVGFDRDVSYDVKAEGRAVVIRSGDMGGAPIERALLPPAAPVDLAAKEHLEQARKEAEAAAARATQERRQAEQAAEQAHAQQQEAKRLAAEAERLSSAAQSAKDEADKLRKQAVEVAERDRAKAEQAVRDAEQRQREVEAQARALAASRAEAERLAAQAERARRDAEEAAARAEAKHKQQVAELEEQIAKAQSEKRDAEAARARAVAAKQEAERARQTAERAKAEAERTRQETAARLSEITERERQAKLAQEQAAGARREADEARRQLESERQRLASVRSEIAAQQKQIDAERAKLEKKASAAERTARSQQAADSRESERARRELEAERQRLAKLKEDLERQQKSVEEARKHNEERAATLAAVTPASFVQASAPTPTLLASTAGVTRGASGQAASRAPFQLRGIDRKGSGASAGVFLALDGAPEYEVQVVDDPPRLVVDLKHTVRKVRRTTYGVDTPFVRRVRLGEQSDGLRAVFDLSSTDVEHHIAPTDGGLLVSLRARAQTTVASAPVAQPGSAPAAARPAAPTLGDVQFKGDGMTARIVIAADEKVETRVDDRSKKSWVLELRGTRVPSNLERSLDTTAYGTVVRMVSTYQATSEPPTVNVVASLTSGATQRLYREGKNLIWEIKGEAPAPMVATTRAPQTAGFASEAAVMARSAPAQSSGRGKRVSLNFKDADIVNVIRLIADATGENIITSEDVKGKVTVKLRNVPWEMALDTILKTKGYDKVRHNNILRIAAADQIQKEREMELARKRANEQVEDTIIKIITINYATASEIMAQLKPMLTGRGSVQTDERTNTIILEDVASNIDRIVELTKRLDKQTPQVLIEARIVEASSNFEQELGIQWGGTAQASAATGNPTGLVFPGDIVATGGADDPQANRTQGVTSPGRYAVNLPAPIGAGVGGGIGLVFGSAGGSQLLQLRLSALERSGSGRIVSSPRITTLDNRTAKIAQGVDIPITVVSAAGANTRFVPANLELEVTPHVTNDGSIMMKIKTAKNEPNFSRPGAFGDPTIEKKFAETEVLVRDGDTTVIGGIYTRNTTKSLDEVPFFSKIPVLGWLFRNKRDTDERAELLVFITPRIVNRQESLLQYGESLPGGGG